MNENDVLPLQALHLSHRYDSFPVLEEIDFSLYAGEIAILEGPNGAGKSTLLLCLGGLMRPSEGEIRVNGCDLFADERQARRDLAFVPDVPRFYVEMTAWEHLRFIALAHQAMDGFDDRAAELLRELGLWEARDLYPHAYSRGMSLKLGLALALIRPFRVLLLDEPASALDTASRDWLLQRLDDLRQQGAAILFSTHDPQVKQGWADRAYRLEDSRLTGG